MSPDASPAPVNPKTARTPSGPRGHLLLGVLPTVRKDVLGFLRQTHQDYGDVSRYRLGPITSYLIVHPDGLRQVLQDNVKNYTKDHVSYTMGRWIVGNGLVTSQGSFWLRQRRLAQPAFHRQRVVTLGQRMVQATEEMMERWEAQAPRGEPLEIVEEMMRLTLRIVTEALFGTQVEAQAREISHAFNLLSEQFVTRFRTFRVLPPVLPTRYDREFRTAVQTLRASVAGIIAERRRRNEDLGDLLSMFMLARDEETGEQMDDAQLQDEVCTMMLAGHETTATLLSWVWAVLEQHPRVEARLHAELAEVLGGRPPTAEDVPRLNYTRMVVEETLRLYSPVYILSRKVKEDDVIGGYRITAGASVDFSPWLTHRHPEFWEEPEAFRPERFSPEQVARRPRFAYFPFLGGPRQCIGNNFALMEAQLILASVAQRFQLRAGTGSMPVPEPLITLRPKGGLPMRLQRRSPSA
jgi:cytochrome P450